MHLFNDSKKEKSIEPAKKSQRGQKRLREQVPIESSSTAHIAKPETSPKREEQVGGLGEALLKDKRFDSQIFYFQLQAEAGECPDSSAIAAYGAFRLLRRALMDLKGRLLFCIML